MWFQVMLSKGPFSWFHLRAPKWSVNIKHKKNMLFSERNGYVKTWLIGPICISFRKHDREPLPPGTYNVQVTDMQVSADGTMRVHFETLDGREVPAVMKMGVVNDPLAHLPNEPEE